MKAGYLIAAIGIALLVILGLQYTVFSEPEATPEVVVDDTPADRPPAAEMPAIAVPEAPVRSATQPVPPAAAPPTLADSDDWLREQLDGLPFPSGWLQIDQLLRRGAAVLSNTAQGTYPRRQVAFLVPQETFPVERRGERYFLDPAGFARFDHLPDLLEQIPQETLAGVWRRSRPMLVDALAELGVADSPESLLRQTLLHMRGVPSVPAGDLELVQPGVQFAFRDDELEQRNDLQKQLLRMGPDNRQRLTDYLSGLLEALEAP